MRAGIGVAKGGEEVKEPRYDELGATTLKRISNSTHRTFAMCAERYWLLQDVEERATTMALAIGSAVAKGVEFDNRGKIGRENARSLGQLLEISESYFAALVEESEHAASVWEVERARDDAVAAMRCYLAEISPKVLHVVATEKSFRARIGHGIELVGRMDTVCDAEVRDIKTGRRWRDEDAHRSLQLTDYDLLFEAEYETRPRVLWIDSVYRVSGGWRARAIPTHRSQGQRARFVESVRRTVASIESGAQHAAPEGAWWCSREYCPVWQRCRVRGWD